MTSGINQYIIDDDFDILEEVAKAYEQGKRDAEPHWTPCSVTLPLKKGVYIVTGRNGTVSRFLFSDTDASKEYWNRAVLAWMPLPEPYKGGQDD